MSPGVTSKAGAQQQHQQQKSEIGIRRAKRILAAVETF